ncbi:MAG: nicotinate-nucleotide adenylyltransferase [SAR202 cluster bacterium]|nr:nicotinate-nucleotide adenylyltransferase [SAR202 cluster bacterium]
MRIGVFGGTFDPVHVGHLLKAEEAREGLGLDEVWFVPAGNPWMKSGRTISPAHDRMEMVRLATASNPHFKVSDIETVRHGPSYMADTLAELRAQFGDGAELFLLIGADSLRHIARWRSPDEVLRLCTVAVFERPGRKGGEVERFDRELLDGIRPGAGKAARAVQGTLTGISGTDIRERVATGRSIAYRVPEAVGAYIAEHGLYKS